LAIAALAVLASGAAARAAEPYHLGTGYGIGDFNIAGYSNIVANLPKSPYRRGVAIDDLSLFVTGHVNSYLNPLIEAELSGIDLFHSGGPGGDGGPYAMVERFYDDVALSDSLTLRLGKMLTPVGEWNLIHAAPLELTTTRPIVTTQAFGDYTSGLSVLFSGADGPIPEAQVYWQPDGDIAPQPSEVIGRHYRNVEGLHLNWPLGLTDKAGASFQHARIVGEDATQYLSGLNGKISWGRASLNSEATYAWIHDDKTGIGQTEWGGYVLGAYALTPELSAQAWYEEFQHWRVSGRARDVLFGLSYKPRPPIVWKAEWVQNFGDVTDTPTGFYASFSVLY
jgi:hypothetical protein